ncbi:MAG: hypothetical protein PHG00_15005 [Methylococcales bacterium]|nr:hypothetical protein [Methylococcales bacterium]
MLAGTAATVPAESRTAIVAKIVAAAAVTPPGKPTKSMVPQALQCRGYKPIRANLRKTLEKSKSSHIQVIFLMEQGNRT